MRLYHAPNPGDLGQPCSILKSPTGDASYMRASLAKTAQNGPDDVGIIVGPDTL